jgi:23S rRNA pseudouridine1911/1915/1917 synthase
MRKFNADKSADGLRADVFISKKLPKFTRSSLKHLFKQGFVKVNNISIKSSRRVHPSDKFTVDDRLLKSVPSPLDLPVIYEDEDVVVVDKPAGALTHSKGALNTEATVASSLRHKLDRSLSGNRAGIVHRLDRGTSGLIIIAKNPASLSFLQKQFATRKVEKIYEAVVEGVPATPQAIIDAPIDRNPKRPQTFVVKSTGKAAQTKYYTKKTGVKQSKNYSLLELKPLTGRTHQLRVHLKYIGHPIYGDPVYGHGGNRIMLHAYSLRVRLPSGERKLFKSPLPAVFKEFFSGAN